MKRLLIATLLLVGLVIAVPASAITDSQRLAAVQACLDAGTDDATTVACVRTAMAPAPVPTTTAPPTTTTVPPTTTTPPPTTGYPPPSTEGSLGEFHVRCNFSHQKQVDPIVVPGPDGTLSAHMHDFFGNKTTNSDSTYSSMTAGATSCDLPQDTAGYWAPSLVRPDGTFVKSDHVSVYYRNRPTKYGTTATFPANFRMIAGGPAANAAVSNPVAYWTCHGESDSALANRRTFIPDCGSSYVIAHIYFPSCWDGTSLDSPDHRSHMVYARNPKTGAVTNIDSDAVCPPDHPVKTAQIDLRVLFPTVHDGTGYVLSDGNSVIHADFWNTWDQASLDRATGVCLRAHVVCGNLTSIP